MSDKLWQPDLGDGNFQNPILYADYSDPDVVRVGDTYYMTASSFNYTPGLPILVSKDLVNWELKNYAVKNIEFDRYETPAHAKGIWAPAIRYHDGMFYIAYGMPDEGIFIVRAKDPLGQWEEPTLIYPGKGYIDPCPFWDDDGQAYIIHGYARSRIGFKSILGIFKMNPEGTKALDEDHFVYDGTVTQKTIEGPKVEKRNGYYYIFAPAGGVKTGWQTVLRSENIYGPYEEKIVMHQGDSPTNGPHQGALIDTPSGEEWFIHFQDKGFYGRITHLQPVRWKNDWPMIGINPNEDDCGEPCVVHKKPAGLPSSEPLSLQASDDFSGEALDLMWQWMGNHKEDFYALTEEGLRLNALNPAGDETPTLWHSSNVLTQKFVCPEFEALIEMDYAGLSSQEQAGVVMMGGQYLYIALRQEDNERFVVLVESEGNQDTREERLLQKLPISGPETKMEIKMKLTKVQSRYEARFLYRVDLSGDFIDTHVAYEPSDHTWVGAKLGLFASALDKEKHSGYASFKKITVESL